MRQVVMNMFSLNHGDDERVGPTMWGEARGDKRRDMLIGGVRLRKPWSGLADLLGILQSAFYGLPA